MKYTEEQMRQTINEWKVSGLSKKAFCRDRNVVYQAYHNWSNRINKVPSSAFTEITFSIMGRRRIRVVPEASGARHILDAERRVLTPAHQWRAANLSAFRGKFEKNLTYRLRYQLLTYDQQRFHRVDKPISLFHQCGRKQVSTPLAE